MILSHRGEPCKVHSCWHFFLVYLWKYLYPYDMTLIKTPEGGQRIEQREDKSPFIDYLDVRFKGEDWMMASSLTRQKEGGMEVGEYKDRMKEIGEDIIQVFGIDPNLFQDGRYAECLVAVCDGYLVNMKRDPTGKEFDETRDFLTSTVRTLAGLRASYNKDEFKAESPDASFYYVEGVDEEKTERFKKIMRHMNLNESERVKSIFNDWAPESPMHKTREILGIKGSEDEVGFEVLVVNTKSYANDNDENPSWAEICGAVEGEKAPFSAFKDINPETGRPVIVMPAFIVDYAISEKLVGHEYMHTQREFSFGFNNNLGFMFEETLANTASGGQTHFSADKLISLLNKSLGDELLMRESKLALTGEKTMGEYFQFIANTFGFRSLLLLLTTSPSAYEHFENSLEPAIKSAKHERMGSLLTEVLKESDEIDSQRRNRLIHHFSKMGGKSAEIGDDVTNYWKLNELSLPSDLQESFDACFFDPYTQSYLPDN